MKKYLSIFLGFFVLLTVLAASFPQPAKAVLAADISPAVEPSGTYWVVDPEVTFIGKNAARAGNLLDWTLTNYQWVCVTKHVVSYTAKSSIIKGAVGGTETVYCNNNNNPIASFWLLIVSYIVAPLLFVVILASAMVIIITRGRSLTIMRFLPRFVAVIILIFFSYAIIQFLYQFVDMIQGFFLESHTASCPPDCITQNDLLYVGWDYTKFVGLRLIGDYNAESAFISLLLTKLTALTYFVMIGILIMRKIILWFFIIISPIFPLLLLFYPIRNTGKIWVGEFFRWLLYAPLFAIFLKGLVYMWRYGIPLPFAPPVGSGLNVNDHNFIYPTAVNILLGGPRQFVTQYNSVNLTETFALYVVALIMLWIVILLPWILLQIFLDYASNFAPGDSAVMKSLVNLATNRKAPVAPAGPGSQGGEALTLPFAKFSSKMKVPVSVSPEYKPGGAALQMGAAPAGAAQEIVMQSPNLQASFAQPLYMPSAQVNAQALNVTSLSLPTMRDIARFDTASLSNDTSKQQEMMQMSQILERIANPVAVASTTDRDKYVEIRDKLTEQSQQGNQLATSILNAASSMSQKTQNISTSDLKNILQQIANPASVASVVDREKMTQIKDMLSKESSANNNQLASSILSVSERSSASEIEKIREQLALGQQQNIASSVMSQVSSAQNQNMNQMRSVFQQIANPATSTNSADHERYSKLHDMMEKESKENNNQLASSILSVSDKTSVAELEKITQKIAQGQMQGNSVASSVNSAVKNTQIRSILQQIANPASVTGTKDRERFSKLHDMLQNESSQNNNQLATSILSISDKTTDSELEKIKDTLVQSQSQNSVASAVASTINNVARQTQSTEKVRSVLQQVANPASISSPVDREKISKLNNELIRASKEGNQLASSILSVSDKTSTKDIEKLQARIMDAKAKGESVGVNMAELTQKTGALPALNRIQSVSQEDYQAVKDMWKENYHNMEVPQGMTGTRSDWVKDDITNIDKIVGLLSSTNEEEVSKGLQEVSNILPFLMVGGFSQTEIVSYLKAKQEAAKEVSTELANEEEEKISITTHRAETQKTMAAETPVSTEQAQAPQTNYDTTNIITPQATNEILAMVNLKLPRMRDVVRYETMSISRDRSKVGEVQKVHEMLDKIANPSTITVSAERERYEKLRDKLMEEGGKGNVTANLVLSAAQNGAAMMQAGDIKTVLQQIANPSSVTTEADRERFTSLHDTLVKESKENNNQLANTILSVNDTTSSVELEKVKDQLQQGQQQGNQLATNVLSIVTTAVQTTKIKRVFQQMVNPASAASGMDRQRFTEFHDKLTQASQQGNQLASSLLSVQDKTSIPELEKLNEKIKEAKEKGDSLAQEIYTGISTTVALPEANRIQTVSQEDYEDVKNMWKENYKKLEVPEGMSGSRTDWIKDDITKIDNVVTLLSSSDPEKVNEGLQEVSNILPFLMVGGFSQTEIVSYLKAKQEAAKEVSTELTNEEEEKVSVSAQKTEAQKTMAAETPVGTEQVQTPEAKNETTNIVTTQVSNEILGKVDFKLPRMQDIAKLEAGMQSHDKSKTEESEKIRETLEKIANPAPIEIGLERVHYEKLRDQLVEESQNGNTTADIILKAVAMLSQESDEVLATLADIKTVLSQIAKPEKVTDERDRDFYIRLHDYLIRESKENNSEIAMKVLSVNDEMSVSEVDEIKEQLQKEKQQGNKIGSSVIEAINNFVENKQFKSVLQHISDPASLTSPIDREHYTKLQKEIKEASDKGNALASSVLSVKESTPLTEIDKLKKDLKDSKQKGEDLGKNVLANITKTSITDSSRTQAVSNDDYEEVKKLWIEYYKNLPLTNEFSNDVKGRIEWINSDIDQIKGIVNLLGSKEQEKIEDGMKRVSGILPFLMLGGFSLQEIIKYLTVKEEAGEIVKGELQKEEQNQVTVEATQNKQEKPKEDAIEEDLK